MGWGGGWGGLRSLLGDSFSVVAPPSKLVTLGRAMVLLDTPYQLPDAGPAAVGSSRAYLLETQVLPSVECGIEDMLRACTAAAEAGERVDPINFLATYLMRNNPRHSGAALERLASHQRAKELAAAKETAERERLLAYEQARVAC